MIKRNIFKCVDEEMLKQVQHDGSNRSHPETRLSHPEFISGSPKNKEMLNPVQHDDNPTGQMLNPVQYDGKKGRHPETRLSHPEFISGSQESKQMLNPVQHDSSSIGQMPSPVQYDGKKGRHPETRLSHPEFISGSPKSRGILKQVQYDDRPAGQMSSPVQHNDRPAGQIPNPAQYDGWRCTSLSLGRSMIEMLGVLAVIGVLSIGGLYAYRQAMNRYKTNEIIHFLFQFRLAAMQVCTPENCKLKGPYGQNYFDNAMLLCNTMGNPPGFCKINSNGWAELSFLNDTATWVSHTINNTSKYKKSLVIQISSLSREECIAFSNPQIIDEFFITDNTSIFHTNGKWTEEQKQQIEDYCTNKVETKRLIIAFRLY